MSDPREPTDIEPDARDERLAALLAVSPLDEVTRNRLVREALERPVPRPSRLPAAMAVAAAVIVGIVVGTVLVQDENPVATTTAQGGQPSVTNNADAEAFELQKDASPGAAESAPAPITPLGGLGDITKPADLLEAIDGGVARSAGPTDDSAVPLAYPCASTPAETFDLVATTALGLGFYRGFPVTIFVGTSPDGEARAVVVRQDDCTELASVKLQQA